MEEEVLTSDTLYQAVSETYKKRISFIETMEKSTLNNAVETIMDLIRQCAKS